MMSYDLSESPSHKNIPRKKVPFNPQGNLTSLEIKGDNNTQCFHEIDNEDDCDGNPNLHQVCSSKSKNSLSNVKLGAKKLKKTISYDHFKSTSRKSPSPRKSQKMMSYDLSESPSHKNIPRKKVPFNPQGNLTSLEIKGDNKSTKSHKSAVNKCLKNKSFQCSPQRNFERKDYGCEKSPKTLVHKDFGRDSVPFNPKVMNENQGNEARSSSPRKKRISKEKDLLVKIDELETLPTVNSKTSDEKVCIRLAGMYMDESNSHHQFTKESTNRANFKETVPIKMKVKGDEREARSTKKVPKKARAEEKMCTTKTVKKPDKKKKTKASKTECSIDLSSSMCIGSLIDFEDRSDKCSFLSTGSVVDVSSGVCNQLESLVEASRSSLLI